MITLTNSKVTPFGGITIIHEQLISRGTAQFIENELGKRRNNAQYSYADIILTRLYTVLSGGSAAEDVQYITENTLQHLKKINIPSPDTILRADKELSTASEFIGITDGKKNKININEKLNRFLIRSAVYFGQLKPGRENLTLDFDHVFIPTEKYDATYSYKHKKGYFPAVASINNIPVYVEGRNGNCSVKTDQLSTHKRIWNLLQAHKITPASVRMDAGSYIKEVTDFYHEQGVKFFIRANQSETLLFEASTADNWKSCTINHQNFEVTSFDYEFGQYTHRIIAYRYPNKTGQISALTGDAKNYLFIITNDREIDEKEAIEFYNQRGDSERLFDIQNNDFNWKVMPHSFLEENTVYLILMAFVHVVYKYLLEIFSSVVEGLTQTSRLKRFIFRLVNIVAKFTRSGRRQIIHLATKNKKLLMLLNSS